MIFNHEEIFVLKRKLLFFFFNFCLSNTQRVSPVPLHCPLLDTEQGLSNEMLNIGLN